MILFLLFLWNDWFVQAAAPSRGLLALFAVAAALLLGWAARRTGPPEAWAWLCLGLGALAAPLGWALEGALLLAGVLLLPGPRRTPYEAFKSALNIAVLLPAVALAYWNYNPTRPLPADLIRLLALVLAAARIFAGQAGWAHGLVAAGLAARLAGGLLGGAGLLLLGASGWVRARGTPAQSVLTAGSPSTRWAALLPAAAVLLAYGLLLHSLIRPMPMTRTELILSTGVVVVLATLRHALDLAEARGLLSDLQAARARLRAQSLDLERTHQEKNLEASERRRAEERRSHDALHDTVTGLPNRALFLDRLDQARKRRLRDAAYQYALLYLDLDGFKIINDSLGHAYGDRLLAEIGRILSGLVRPTDTVARLGGDEFAILLDETRGVESMRATAAQVLAELGRPVTIDGRTVFISASIGIVDCSGDCEPPEDLLRDADLAMYQAKSAGRGRYEVFDARTRSRMVERLAIENDLREALERGDFELHYQPILQLPARRLVGFEALARWQHPARGLVQPGDFIPIAEETGLIVPLGQWVLNTACREARLWQEVYPSDPPLKVNVNISAVQFQQPDFLPTVDRALVEAGLDGSCLVLEVTESACLENIEQVSVLITALKARKVEVQIDDFGTGYSSLSYLHRLPVDKIKIDRSFIQTIDANTTPDMVRAILSLTNTMGIAAVAEGIENEPQADAMQLLNCSYVQGYWFARPMPPDAALRWIGDHDTSD